MRAMLALILCCLPCSAGIIDFGSIDISAGPATITVADDDGDMADIRFTFNPGTSSGGGVISGAGSTIGSGLYSPTNVVGWQLAGEAPFIHSQTSSILMEMFATGTLNPLSGDFQTLHNMEFSPHDTTQMVATGGIWSGSGIWSGIGTDSINTTGTIFGGFNSTGSSFNPTVSGASSLLFSQDTYGTFGTRDFGFQLNLIDVPAVAAVPEPSSLMLVLPVSLFLATRRRRK